MAKEERKREKEEKEFGEIWISAMEAKLEADKTRKANKGGRKKRKTKRKRKLRKKTRRRQYKRKQRKTKTR